MAFLILKEGNSLLYKSSENLLAGLDTSPDDEDSLEVLEVYERFIDPILELYTLGTTRTEQELRSEVIKASESIEGLNQDFVPEILDAFTSFFLYDLEQGKFIIQRNIDYKSKDGVITVSTKKEDKMLLEFSPKANSIVDDTWPPSVIDNKLSTFIKNLFKILALLAFIAVIARLGYGLYSKWLEQIIKTPVIETNIKDDVKGDTIISNVVNDLELNGRLYIEEDTSLVTKYYVSRDENVEIDEIDWQKTKILNKGDTLYPKENCYIHVLTTKNDSNNNNFKFERFAFNLGKYVELLIKTRGGSTVLSEMLDFSFSQPLTILYDDIQEDVCQKPNDKGLVTNFRIVVGEQKYQIDSIRFYSSSEGRNDILSRNYPQIEFIGCVSK